MRRLYAFVLSTLLVRGVISDDSAQNATGRM
jgi:hypothetical protein